MKPVSPVLPQSEGIEVVLGKDQPQYIPLPAIYLDRPDCPMITRWQLTEEEREMIAQGADIILQQLTFQHPFQPVNLQVVMPGTFPELVEDVSAT